MADKSSQVDRPARRDLAAELEEAARAEVPSQPEASDVRERMLKLAARLWTGGAVSGAYIRRRFGVSVATSKRDLVVLEQTLPVVAEFRRGNGGRVKLLRLMPSADALIVAEIERMDRAAQKTPSQFHVPEENGRG